MNLRPSSWTMPTGTVRGFPDRRPRTVRRTFGAPVGIPFEIIRRTSGFTMRSIRPPTRCRKSGEAPTWPDRPLAEERARKREALLTATESELEKVRSRVAAGRRRWWIGRTGPAPALQVPEPRRADDRAALDQDRGVGDRAASVSPDERRVDVLLDLGCPLRHGTPGVERWVRG